MKVRLELRIALLYILLDLVFAPCIRAMMLLILRFIRRS